MLKNLLVKLIGKRLDAALVRWGVSKGKVIAVLGVIVYAAKMLAPVFGYPITVPEGVEGILISLGLWALREGSNTDAVLAASTKLSDEVKEVVKPA